MTMTLVFGTAQGIGSAERFAIDYFGTAGLRIASRAKIDGLSCREQQHPALPYSRFLKGDLEPIMFDGHTVGIDDMAEYDGGPCIDIARDGVIDTLALLGELDYHALGVRTVVRWLSVPNNLVRHHIEIWSDLNEAELPIVSNPNPRQEIHVRFGLNWR